MQTMQTIRPKFRLSELRKNKLCSSKEKLKIKKYETFLHFSIEFLKYEISLQVWKLFVS